MANNESNACVLLLDLPEKAFCGIDLLSFTTSPRFHGVKHLPPGYHLVFCGVNSSFSLRSGAWFHVKEQTDNLPDLHIKKWLAQNEELVAETDVASVLKWRANLGSIWREGLTPYRQTVTSDTSEGNQPQEEKVDWHKLTDCITQHVLDRITGTSAPGDHWDLTSASSCRADIDDIPGLSKHEVGSVMEKDLGFLPINLKQTWREGAVGRERTLAAQDRSWALLQLITTLCKDPLDIIGELQFCFLSLLTLNNNSCLEQWKRIMGLILTSFEAIQQYPELFTRFISTLKLQLEHCQDAEGGLFDMREEGSTLLRPLLKKFRTGLEQQSGAGKLDIMDELDDLEEYLRAEHGWLLNQDYARQGMLQLEDGEEVMMDMNPEDGDDDYAPMMVELTREQAEELGLEYVEPEVKGYTLPHKHLQQPVDELEPESEEEMDLEEMDARY